MRECNCGSGCARFALLDARGIFCAYVCKSCIKAVKLRYRPEIFVDCNYETSEPVDDY